MSRVLVIQAESRTMNPLLDQQMIDAELADDQEAASSEWLGLFRASTTQAFSDADIDDARVADRRELPFLPRTAYTAMCDPSGGRHDAMTLAIAHRAIEGHDDALILDRLLIEKPPFDPESVVQRFSETLRSFGLTHVTADRYGAEWVSSAFKKYGLTLQSSDLDKSAIYSECIPLFAQGRVELLDIPLLITQLRLLERRPRAGGRGDSIDHPPRSSDDAANAACGALWNASRLSLARVTRAGRPRQEFAIL